MHIPKLLAVFCLAALGAFTLNAQRADTDAQAKAREQLRQAMQQLDAQQAVAPASVPATPAPRLNQRPAVVAPAPIQSSPDGLNQDNEAKARQKLREAAAQLNAQQPQPPIEPYVPAKPAPAPKTKVAKKPVETGTLVVAQPAPEPKKKAKVAKAAPVYPTEAAPSIVAAPGSKEQRLADLLQLYKSDKITPADYHEQRAKILSEP